MRSQLSKLTDRLVYLRRSRGIWGTFRRALGQVLVPLIRIDDFYITMLYFQPGFDVDEKWPTDDDVGTHSVAVGNLEELEALSDEFDGHFDLDQYRNFLTGSPKRLLIIARRPLEDGGCRVIGMRTCEAGIFSIWNRKREIELPDDILMNFDHEVHPEYRGQRVALISRKGLYAYAMKKGVSRMAATIGTHNLSSIKAHMRGSPMIRPALKGKIRRVRLLGGLVDWMTPADKIKALIEAPPADRDE